MTGEPTTTVTGNLTADPDLRYTPGGQPVANFTIASTPRVFRDGEWQDGVTLFLRCTAWGQLAERIAATFGRGTRLLVTGTLTPNTWEAADGTKRTEVRLTVEDAGASVRLSATPVRPPRSTRDGTAAVDSAAGPAAGTTDPWGTTWDVTTGTPAGSTSSTDTTD